MEVKHHCSIPANPLTLGLKTVSLVIRFLGWMTFSRMGTYFSWKVTILQNFTYFDAVVVLPKKKKLFKETHLIKEPDFWKVLLVHTYLLLPFALRAHVVPHTVLELVSRSSRDCYGEMPGAAALTSLGFLPLISVESWFHAGLCCHWTRGLITQLFTNWLSRYLQGWFPSNLTPRVSSDLLQGPVWKLCAPYASLLPLVLYNPSHSSLCQAYLSMCHPYLHLKSFSFLSFVVSSFQCFFAFPLLFSPLWSGLMDLISFCYTDL